MVYKDFFLYTEAYWDFCKGFEIVQELTEAAGINKFNFNRYGWSGEGSPVADPDEHITVRFDFNENLVTQRISAKLEEMKNYGKINNWCSEEDNIWNIEPMNRYPSVYHTAHETSTACAIKFYNEIKNNTIEFNNFKNNKVAYLQIFLPLWLKYSGFTMFNNYSANSFLFIKQLAKKCSESFRRTVDRNQISNKCTFAERLVHLFLNCITVDRSQETEILQNMGIHDFNALANSLEDC